MEHMTGPENSELMTLEEVCEYLKISEGAVRRWLREKYIPAYKVLGCWRFNRAEIVEWVRCKKQEVVEEESTNV